MTTCIPSRNTAHCMVYQLDQKGVDGIDVRNTLTISLILAKDKALFQILKQYDFFHHWLNVSYRIKINKNISSQHSHLASVILCIKLPEHNNNLWLHLGNILESYRNKSRENSKLFTFLYLISLSSKHCKEKTERISQINLF